MTDIKNERQEATQGYRKLAPEEKDAVKMLINLFLFLHKRNFNSTLGKEIGGKL